MHNAELNMFFRTMSQMILTGDIEAAARKFHHPLALYVPSGVLIINSHADIARRLREYRSYCEKLGIQRFEPANISITDSTENRAFLRLDMRHVTAANETVYTTSATFVLARQETTADLSVEMVDFTTPGPCQSATNVHHIQSIQLPD